VGWRILPEGRQVNQPHGGVLIVPYSPFSLENSLTPDELAARLLRITRRRYWGVWSQADARFVGPVMTPGFRLAYVPQGQDSYAPWLVGDVRALPEGSEIDVRMMLHPIAALAMVAFVVVPQYWAIQAGGFSVWWLAAALAFHVLMYYIGFKPDALDAESLIREVAA
jgi:hypothetical protein